MPDTYAQHLGGEKLLFLRRTSADGVEPKVYAAPCSINTDSKLELTSEVYQGKRANCSNPSAPSKTTRRVSGLDVKFTGQGMTDAPTHKALVEAWNAGVPIPGKVLQDTGDVATGWEVEGTWIIDSIGVGGAHREDQPFDISISTTGDFVFDFNLAA